MKKYMLFTFSFILYIGFLITGLSMDPTNIESDNLVLTLSLLCLSLIIAGYLLNQVVLFDTMTELKMQKKLKKKAQKLAKEIVKESDRQFLQGAIIGLVGLIIIYAFKKK